MPKAIAVLRILVGIVAGYALLGLLITLVFENGLGGVSYAESSAGVLLLAGFCGFASAVTGSMAAALISGGRRWITATVMSLLVMAETTWLVTSGRADGPVWFDALGALSLIAGIQLGAFLYGRFRPRPEPAPAL
ncbi:MAG TPA: hypothetical protein VN493_29335 [Thermoanaerobaculia bacterium]|nr:hypothetical protein [Thermoanaerobaculia bacterium]